jgi:hypothetical protein
MKRGETIADVVVVAAKVAWNPDNRKPMPAYSCFQRFLSRAHPNWKA